MVRCPSNFKENSFFLTNEPTEIRVKFRFDLRCDRGATFFGAEDDVVQQIGEGCCQVLPSAHQHAAPPGLGFSDDSVPGAGAPGFTILPLRGKDSRLRIHV